MSLSEVNQIKQGLDMIASGVMKHQAKYLNEFFGMACAVDIMIAKLFPNLKEMTESMAAFTAARNRITDLFSLSDPTVKVFCVGDGHTPRTAALFAFRSRWEAWSIDPELRDRRYDIKRLNLFPQKVEEFSAECDQAVIVAVHSHAPLAACLNSIKARKMAVIAIPCCEAMEIAGKPPDFEYDDVGILSPKRTVKIWRNVG